MRPTLVLVSSYLGEPGRRNTDLGAAAVELVHLATLYHDDVIDETEVRRGVPTVHSRWGVEVAVLAGDYLFARGCALGAEAGGEVPGILANAIGRVCEGQIMETAVLNDPARSVEDYMAVISLKTAALFEAGCELGAATSGAPTGARAALKTFGLNLGLAFQIVDDVLDLVGDPDAIGKAPGSDLREGVFTLPVIVAAQREPAFGKKLLEGERALDVLLPEIEDLGGIEVATAAARDHAAGAAGALEGLEDGRWRKALEGLLDGVLAQAPAS